MLTLDGGAEVDDVPSDGGMALVLGDDEFDSVDLEGWRMGDGESVKVGWVRVE